MRESFLRTCSISIDSIAETSLGDMGRSMLSSRSRMAWRSGESFLVSDGWANRKQWA